MPSDIAVGARFLAGLPSFLQQRISPAQAQLILNQRLARREADFLDLTRRAIYDQPDSPYRPLLQLVGCEYGDLERLVLGNGLLGALQDLYRLGVYLSVDELKGRKPVVRGSARLQMDPAAFLNPLITAGASRDCRVGRAGVAPVTVSFASILECAPNLGLALNARGGIGWQHALWQVPGASSLVHLLEWAPFGRPPSRWFSQVDPNTAAIHPRYRWAERLTRWASAPLGVSCPRPEHVPVEDPRPIVRWLAEELRLGRTPHLKCPASSGVRLSQSALAAGMSLRGVQLTLSAEPITVARMASIRQSGAEALPRCGSSEIGLIGYGCLAPTAVDELHLMDDLNAYIQPPADTAGSLPPLSLLVTSIRPGARTILLNASIGDQAVLTQRGCGCALEQLGWTTQLHSLRSYEKLTTGGMTLLDTDVIRVLEQVLPSRFGGGPTDYQLIEREEDDGEPQLRLLVHPRVGQIDPAAVSESFLTAIGAGSEANRVVELAWRSGRTVRVEREAPRVKSSGKILHLHRQAEERR